MSDKDSSSGSNKENPDRNSDEQQALADYKSSLEDMVQKFQKSNPLDQQHKFWETQPVGQFKDFGNSSLPEGPIEQPTPLSEVKQEPYNLPSLYEWTTCDMGSDEVCHEVYVLLTNNYVEDDDNMFRFNYSKEFLQWALRSPGYFSSWHVGVRVKASKKLVAFISGIPVNMRVRDQVVKMAEVNFLCVHKKLRSKRLAPVMIKEVTRRIHLENIWQAAYTAGVLLPTPLTTSQYWHRTLNPKKLIDVGFSKLGDRMTMSRAIKLYKLPTSTSTPGLRKMELRDVPAVAELLKNYLSRFIVAPELNNEEIEHWLLPRENVIDSYLVESQVTHEITEFFSFYTLPSSILHNQEHSTLKAAYNFYYASTNTPLHQLMNDALIIAKQKDFDVFNALDVMDNATFLKDLKFGQGDGQLYYYLYNYRLNPALKPSELGLVLL
ncbi:OLC1v1037762C1 [Oldenlandia corymbosa var. corymbosa]|uniref:Glycylpeptide N-tetradecanoyltransferase n=1 Tax=Oldenlandia corymbosa var. corymbosa TaxID=529605 RepID=A0AAV1D0T5_OLDCO|nr:OLC1v1037762C1 [Oldenlandia corymbosa var. corymbosa]